MHPSSQAPRTAESDGVVTPIPLAAGVNDDSRAARISVNAGVALSSGQTDVRVRSVSRTGQNIVVVSLVAADCQPLPRWEPGAHIDVVLEDDLIRQYSLCGDPDDAAEWRIAVLVTEHGRASALINQVRPGDVVTVQGPRNHFPLVASEQYVFVAGGIGITPILPMVQRVAHQSLKWTLVYGGRCRNSMAFADELLQHGDSVLLWPELERGLIDLDNVLGTPQEGTAIYCCGPESLLNAIESRCTTWPKGTLHVERFAPSTDSAQKLEYASPPFIVDLARTGQTINIAENESIIDALERAGIPTTTACRNGVCGTCETRVLDGSPDHRDSVLTESERQANDTMMICCSRSRSPRLVIDM